jgi:hypothetical protein
VAATTDCSGGAEGRQAAGAEGCRAAAGGQARKGRG